jgi:hypothetical protein
MNAAAIRVDRGLPTSGQVRQVFEESGGHLSTSELAELCHDLGIEGFTDEDADKAAMRHFQSQCRKALKSKDATGLPFAGRAATGEGQWVARRFWEVPDYQLNIAEYIDQRDENDRIAMSLGAECADRFGVDPYSERGAA